MQPQGPNAASSDPLSVFDTERRPARVVPGPGVATNIATEPRRTITQKDHAAKGVIARIAPSAPAPVPTTPRPTVAAREATRGQASSWARVRGSLWFFALGAAFGSALAVFLALQISGSQVSAKDPLPSPNTDSSRRGGSPLYGSLAINSSPIEARAYVNGSLVGLTPVVLPQVPVGSRVIRLEAIGHAPWISTVRIVADQQTRVAVTLSPAR